MKSDIYKQTISPDNTTDYKEGIYIGRKDKEAPYLNKSMEIKTDHGYVSIIIPSNCSFESKLTRLLATHHYHDIDEIEEDIKSAIMQDKFYNPYNNVVSIYTYYAENSDTGMENIYDAGYSPDMPTPDEGNILKH